MAMAEDPIFQPVSGKDSLELLAGTIREDKPRSSCIHNMIIMHAKGYSNLFDAYSQKSNPLCIMLVNKSDNGIVCVYCPESDEDKLLDALKKTKLIPWEMFNCALYVPKTFCDKMSMLIIMKAGCEVFRKDGKMYLYAPENVTMKLKVPVNYSLRKIGVQSAIQMEKVAEPLFVCQNIGQYRELYMTAPNCCVYNTNGTKKKLLDFDKKVLPEPQEDGVALAWACTDKEGQLGIVCANEAAILKLVGNAEEEEKLEERLTRLVIDACSLQMIKEGFVVHTNLHHGLSPVPDMPDWKRVGYSYTIYSSYSSLLSEEGSEETGEDETERDEERDEEDLEGSEEAEPEAEGEENVGGTVKKGQVEPDADTA